MAEINPDAPADATIKRLVVEELYWDNRLDVSKIKVEVTDGTVILTGHVPTLTDRLSAEADARMIKNVITVENELQIERPSIVPDPELRSNVQTILTWAPDVDNADIGVSVTSGTVTLRGTVPRYWDKLRAHLLTRSISGVVEIVDELAVVPSRDVADQEIAHSLMRAIDRRLWEETSMVQVTVNGGVVTLRGSVPDRTAYQRAEETAQFTTGVVEVKNELCIQQCVGRRG